MTESDAKTLAAKLAAAFPRDWLGQATVEVYTERLMKLKNVEAASATIDKLIDSAIRLPTIGEIRDLYRRELVYHEQPALPEPEMTEGEREANLERVRVLLNETLGGGR